MSTDVGATRNAQPETFAPRPIESQHSDFDVLFSPVNAVLQSGSWSSNVEAEASCSEHGLGVWMVEELDVVEFFGGTNYV